MIEEFREHLIARRRSPNTIRLRLVYLRQLNDIAPLNTITPQQIEQLLAAHRDDWKPETVNAAISSWRVYYRWATRNGHRTDDPTADIELAYVPHVVKTLADDSRINDALITASTRNRAIMLLGRELGLRRTEIATLRKSDREGTTLRVTGKGGRTRRLPVTSKTLVEALTELEATVPGEFYFQGRSDGHISPSQVWQIVTTLIDSPTHSLRRKCLTEVYEGTGYDLRAAQEFAGHADPNTTAIYIDIPDKRMVAAARAARLAA